jgi:hypothetical protein
MKWQKIKSSLANAFAYDDGRAEITDEDIAILDKVAEWVIRRRMVAPAILILESSVPLNFVGSSMLTFFRPIVGIAFSTNQWERFEALLEKRCSMRLLIERIEKREAEDETERKAKKAAGRAPVRKEDAGRKKVQKKGPPPPPS